eukprot:5090173-Prymnesium_polylepis.1
MKGVGQGLRPQSIGEQLPSSNPMTRVGFVPETAERSATHIGSRTAALAQVSSVDADVLINVEHEPSEPAGTARISP